MVVFQTDGKSRGEFGIQANEQLTMKQAMKQNPQEGGACRCTICMRTRRRERGDEEPVTGRVVKQMEAKRVAGEVARHVAQKTASRMAEEVATRVAGRKAKRVAKEVAGRVAEEMVRRKAKSVPTDTKKSKSRGAKETPPDTKRRSTTKRANIKKSTKKKGGL